MIKIRWFLATLNGLYGDEAEGFVKYGLTKEQVLSKNYGSHTLSAMQILKKQGRAKNNEVAFSKVKELNIYQAIGVSIYHLSRKQVMSFPSFNFSTLEEIDKIKQGSRPIDYLAAFEIIKKSKEHKNRSPKGKQKDIPRPVKDNKRPTITGNIKGEKTTNHFLKMR